MTKNTKDNLNNYNASSIEVLEGLDAVRKRPGMYVGALSKSQLHLFKEILDNSIDEFLNGFGKVINVIFDEQENTITVEDQGRGMPVDIHPKAKIPAVELLFMKLHSGGKYHNGKGGAFKVSGGMNGVGLGVVNACSTRTVCRVKRDGKIYEIIFSKGKLIEQLKVVGTCKKNETGTSVTFKPDPEVLKNYYKLNEDDVLENIELRSFINADLLIKYENVTTGKKEEFYHENGILDLLEIKNTDPLTKPFHAVFEDEAGNEYELAFQWNSRDLGAEYNTFVNSIVMEKSTTDNAIRNGISDSIKSYITANVKKVKEMPNVNDITEGLKSIISIKHLDPEFTGQNKTEFANEDVSAIKIKAKELMDDYLQDDEYKKQSEYLVKRIIELSAKRKEALDMRKKIVEVDLSNSGFALSAKFIPCLETDPDAIEICIVEGDSAGGSVKDGRDRNVQALIKLRGKVKNAFNISLNTALDNKEFNDMIKAIFGTTDLKNIDYDKDVKFHKIIFYCDADTDGLHINSLLLNFFYRFAKELFRRGWIYIACPPLFRVVEKGKKNIYLKDMNEYNKYIEQKLKKIYKIDSESTNLTLIDIIKNKDKYVEQFELLKKKYFIENDMLDTLIYCLLYEEMSLKDTLQTILESYEELKPYKKEGKVYVSGFIGYNYHDFEISNDLKKELQHRLSGLYDDFILSYYKNGQHIEDATISDLLLDMNTNKIQLNRLKGLGEMNPEELAESCLDPNTRNLIQVTLNEDDTINDEIFKIFFGSNSDLRKKFVDKVL